MIQRIHLFDCRIKIWDFSEAREESTLTGKGILSNRSWLGREMR